MFSCWMFQINIVLNHNGEGGVGGRKLTTVFEESKYRCKICLDYTFEKTFKPEKGEI